MYFTNTFLIQIDHANRLAGSKWPQERRLALILLDNVFELYLLRKIENIFLYDREYWDKSRKYSSEIRSKTLRHYSRLLELAKKENLLTAEEQTIFDFIHDIRNEIYHGNLDTSEKLIDVALHIACDLIRKHPTRWTDGGWHVWSSEVGYGNRYFKKDTLYGSDHKRELSETVFRLLNFGKRTKVKAAKMLEEVVADEMKRIRYNLSELRSAIDQVDFNIIFGSANAISNTQIKDLKKAPKARQLLVILAYYDCVNEMEETLLDEKDRSKRVREFHSRLVKALRNRPSFPLSSVEKFSRRDLAYSTKLISEAIGRTNGILNSVRRLSKAAETAASAWDGWVQHQVDLARGK